MQQVFSIGDAVGFGWKKFKEQPGFFIAFVIVVFFVQAVISGIEGGLEKADIATGLIGIVSLIGFIVSLILGLWQVRISLNVADGKPGAFSDFNAIVPLIGKGILTQLLYMVIVFVGLLLLVIPGLIWLIKYQYALYFVIDKGMKPFEALEASGKLTDGVKWQLVLFNIVIGLINLAGALLIGIGLIVSVPVSIIAAGYVYRQMQRFKGAQSSQEQTPPPTPAAV